MKKMTAVFATGVMAALAATIYAGDVYRLKCETKPGKGAEAGGCGYKTEVSFGGGMRFSQITGYCRACKKFVYLQWTHENTPAATPRPQPLGEVWDGRTGEVLTIYACPNCKGPFLEIKNPADLKVCPACNKAHVDLGEPAIAYD